MSDQMDGLRPPFVPARLTPGELEARRQNIPRAPAKGADNFAEALREAEKAKRAATDTPVAAAPDVQRLTLPGSDLRLSAHAEARLRTRDIHLTSADAAHINQAVELAQAKGAQESLILYDDLALIVSIRNKLVITALERGDSQANVFTHIDSAVVLTGSRTP